MLGGTLLTGNTWVRVRCIVGYNSIAGGDRDVTCSVMGGAVEVIAGNLLIAGSDRDVTWTFS